MRDPVTSMSSTQVECRTADSAEADSVIAARVRRGVRLPNGRTAGESDRQVHLFPVAIGSPAPSQLTALCGLAIEPGMADLVDTVSGLPCEACLLAAAANTRVTSRLR
jgi:hypothetical protein